MQFTAPDREGHIANRKLATIEEIDGNGNLQLRPDSGRAVEFNTRQNPHLDYGYAVTSHSSYGQTADRVLVLVDTEQAREKLINQRRAYVAISRGRYDAKIYTNNKGDLVEQLSRELSHRSALEASRVARPPAAGQVEMSSARGQTQDTQAAGRSISRRTLRPPMIYN